MRRGGWKDRTFPEEGGDQVEKSVGGGARRIGWIGQARARVRLFIKQSGFWLGVNLVRPIVIERSRRNR